MYQRTKYSKNFGGFQGQSYQSAQAVILPVPYDRTSSFGKGADRGPSAVIAVSPQIEYYDSEFDCEPYQKFGIFSLPEIAVKKLSPEKMIATVAKKYSELIKDKKFVAMLGGEHSITPPAVSALKKHYPSLSVLQWDAHADLRDSYEGTKNSHACAMRRCYDEVDRVVQVGIRSYCAEESDFINERKISGNIFSPRRFGFTPEAKKKAIADIVSRLSDEVYITIDLDGFDPSVLPATGTPEPGGLSWYDFWDLMRAVFEKKTVVGFDIVELAPIKGFPASEFTAALAVYKLLAYKFLLKK
ncbi:MAG: agmatinase [Candidatus Magasanikbacteria bacterium]|jgi:agmatinase